LSLVLFPLLQIVEHQASIEVTGLDAGLHRRVQGRSIHRCCAHLPGHVDVDRCRTHGEQHLRSCSSEVQICSFLSVALGSEQPLCLSLLDSPGACSSLFLCSFWLR
jgi:hypothetical protein